MTDSVQINCRTVPAGGDIDPLRAWLAVPSVRGKSHIIVLIHGYNDTFGDATTAYRAFRDLQTAMVSPGLDWAFGATLVEVFWPGDARWGIARPAFYPWALPVADKIAELLSEIVRDLWSFSHGQLTVDVVSHSMGNRVALRMLSLAQDIEGLNVRRSVHMAAAVPVGRLEDVADELSRGLLVEGKSGKAESMYSHGDDVLAYAFPLGETADFPEEGVMPMALGHRDWVAGHSRFSFVQWDASPAGHGNYWSGKTVQAEVRNVLQLGVTGPRVIDPRSTPVALGPVSSDLESRTIDDRSVGQDVNAM